MTLLYDFENHFLQYHVLIIFLFMKLTHIFSHSSDTTKGEFIYHDRSRSRLAVTFLLIPFRLLAMITSVVSVLMSGLQTDMSPTADLLVTPIWAAVAMPQLRICMSGVVTKGVAVL